MNRFIAIHPDACIGCGTCLAACSQGHTALGLQGEPRLSLVKTRDVSAAVTCHHCEGAPCIQVCPVNAIKRRDGAVIVDEHECVGCKLCACVCPFGAIHPSGTSIAGVAGTMVPTPTYPKELDPMLRWKVGVYTCAVKCDLCEKDPAGPRCVAACPTNALEYVGAGAVDAKTHKKRERAAKAHRVIQPAVEAARGEDHERS